MRCASLDSSRWPTGVLWHDYVPEVDLQTEAPAATGTHEARRQVSGASTTGYVSDCGRRSAVAAVMQVRPLSVSSGMAGSSPFCRSPYGRDGWW